MFSFHSQVYPSSMWSQKNSSKFKKSEKSHKFYNFTQSKLELTGIKTSMASEAEKKKVKELLCIIDFEIDETQVCEQFW